MNTSRISGVSEGIRGLLGAPGGSPKAPGGPQRFFRFFERTFGWLAEGCGWKYSGGSATGSLRKKPNPEVRDSSLKIPRFLPNTFLGFRWEPIETQETQGTLVQFLMGSWHASPLHYCAHAWCDTCHGSRPPIFQTTLCRPADVRRGLVVHQRIHAQCICEFQAGANF